MDNLELQALVRSGDSDAFRLLYRRYVSGVYTSAKEARLSEDEIRSVVKEVFVQVYVELSSSTEPVDLDCRVSSITAQAIADRFATASAEMPHPRHVGRAVKAEEPVQTEAASSKIAEELPVKKKGQAANVIALVLSILLLLGALWVLTGVLVSLKILPDIDLGYRAFDRALFPIFLID